MKKLLYLVHRLPYPPNKGDKISSYNMLKYFSARWRVHLGTFIDDPEDWQHLSSVQEMCEDTCIQDLPRAKKITGSISGLLTGRSLSVAYYANRALQDWVKSSVERECPDAVLVYSGVMGQFVAENMPAQVPVVFNAEDVDSEKWRSYAASKSWPVSWLYAREAGKLLQFERKMAIATDVSMFISEDEAALFKRLAPESAHKTFHRKQGVDSNYFDPGHSFDNPYAGGEKPLVFTGAMDYWPNIEAVCWFCEHVLPALRDRDPQVLFCIVGMKPTEQVQRLAELPGVRVTGAVPDVRPYLHYALAACLPLRIARGIQNKALEAMSMMLPVLATGSAMTGIEQPPGTLSLVAEEADEMIELAVDLLAKPRQQNRAGRECVIQNYNWDTNLKRLESVLTGATGAP